MILLRLVRLVRRFRRHRSLSFLAVLGLMLLAILGNALCFYYFDKPLKEDLTFSDALWYSVISVTTIGYGDLSAESLGARLGTIFFIVLMGLAIFSVFLAMIIDAVSELLLRGKHGMTTPLVKDHVVIVNIPSQQRILQVLHEIRSDSATRYSEVVIVGDTLDSLPFSEENVFFVKGSLLDHELYRRARIDEAEKVIVLAHSYTEANSDAIVACIIAIIDKLNPQIHTVAECLDLKHLMLFESVGCNAVVLSMDISSNLLVREAQDPGVCRMIQLLTTSEEGVTLYSAVVRGSRKKMKYGELAQKMLDQSMNLISVVRDNKCITTFSWMQPHTNDRVLYAAKGRLTWDELLDTVEMGKEA